METPSINTSLFQIKKSEQIITNDSPITGLADAKFLEVSVSHHMSKKRGSCIIQGSGESLLRGQVKTLLDKAEENTEISNLFYNQVEKLGYVTPSLFENKTDISQMGSRVFGKKDYVTRSLIYDLMEN